MMVMLTAGTARIETADGGSSSVVVGGFDVGRRRWVETRGGIEAPAAGRWAVLPGPLEHGHAVASGVLEIGSGEEVDASLVITTGTASIHTRLVRADRFGNWSFAGGLSIDGTRLEVAVRMRYEGVFAGGARPVALVRLMGLERPDGGRGRRRVLRQLLVGDVNLTPQP